MGPMSLLRTTAATHRLSSADMRLPGLGTLRRVPTADMRAHRPQSLVLPAGCCTCAALASASRCSAPNHPALWPLGAMRIVWMGGGGEHWRGDSRGGGGLREGRDGAHNTVFSHGHK